MNKQIAKSLTNTISVHEQDTIGYTNSKILQKGKLYTKINRMQDAGLVMCMYTLIF